MPENTTKIPGRELCQLLLLLDDTILQKLGLPFPLRQQHIAVIDQTLKTGVEAVADLLVDDLHQFVRKPDAAYVILEGHINLLNSGSTETETAPTYSQSRRSAPIETCSRTS